MKFHDKLRFLMILTNTTNSSLAKQTSLDASHISRLKNGSRHLVPGADYLNKMASYFSKNLKEEYSISALKDAIEVDLGTELDMNHLCEAIHHWFHSEISAENTHLTDFLHRFSSFAFDAPSKQHSVATIIPNKNPIQIFYGISGKRAAVLEFLSAIIHNNKPMTLLLYSDENMSWLTDDRTFAAKWSSLLQDVILLGCKIKIIHNINRDLDEMLSAISKWLPLYMTGAIEPYYYPKVKDGVFKRTLFVAPTVCALISTSIGNQDRTAANMVYSDFQAVDTFQQEFETYLTLCRPLMQILTKREQAACIRLLLDFDQHESDTMLLNNGLSLVTMPYNLVSGWMMKFHGSIRTDLLDVLSQRLDAFYKLTENHHYIEIIHLPEEESFDRTPIPILFADFFDLPEACYTLDEYLEHLAHIIHLLETVPKYQVMLSDSNIVGNFSLYVKENVGTIVAKSSPSSVVFALNEGYLTGAFWDYLRVKVNRLEHSHSDRAQVILTLKNYIQVHKKDDK